MTMDLFDINMKLYSQTGPNNNPERQDRRPIRQQVPPQRTIPARAPQNGALNGNASDQYASKSILKPAQMRQENITQPNNYQQSQKNDFYNMESHIKLQDSIEMRRRQVAQQSSRTPKKRVKIFNEEYKASQKTRANNSHHVNNQTNHKQPLTRNVVPQDMQSNRRQMRKVSHSPQALSPISNKNWPQNQQVYQHERRMSFNPYNHRNNPVNYELDAARVKQIDLVQQQTKMINNKLSLMNERLGKNEREIWMLKDQFQTKSKEDEQKNQKIMHSLSVQSLALKQRRKMEWKEQRKVRQIQANSKKNQSRDPNLVLQLRQTQRLRRLMLENKRLNQQVQHKKEMQQMEALEYNRAHIHQRLKELRRAREAETAQRSSLQDLDISIIPYGRMTESVPIYSPNSAYSQRIDQFGSGLQIGESRMGARKGVTKHYLY